MKRPHLTSDLIEQVRSYTKHHPELANAHHFLFDLPFVPSMEEVDCFVMGVNPGETKDDWKSVNQPTEETRDYDFHTVSGRSRSSTNWYRMARAFLPTERFIFAEMFFWSSRDAREFRERFGRLIAGNPHVDFCTKLNRELIERYKPRFIVCPGIASLEHAKAIFKLKDVGIVLNNRRHRLIVHCVDENRRPWVFTKHWSGARLSKWEKSTIVQYLAKIFV